MPRRDDLDSILIIGSGPIVIGQACEFDYSGTQACKALRERSGVRLAPDEIVAAMRSDKKGRAGRPGFVLVRRIGELEVDRELDERFLTELLA